MPDTELLTTVGLVSGGLGAVLVRLVDGLFGRRSKREDLAMEGVRILLGGQQDEISSLRTEVRETRDMAHQERVRCAEDKSNLERELAALDSRLAAVKAELASYKEQFSPIALDEAARRVLDTWLRGVQLTAGGVGEEAEWDGLERRAKEERRNGATD